MENEMKPDRQRLRLRGPMNRSKTATNEIDGALLVGNARMCVMPYYSSPYALWSRGGRAAGECPFSGEHFLLKRPVPTITRASFGFFVFALNPLQICNCEDSPPFMHRLQTLSILMLLMTAMICLSGCVPAGDAEATGAVEAIWGGLGVTKAKFKKPRAMAIDRDDNLYIVDMTGRIQVFTAEGDYLRGWRTPTIENGKPSGLSIDHEGNVLVADTHYFRVLVYTKLGKRLKDRTIGGVCGHGPGEFNFVTDAVEDSRGNIFVAEYGEHDRIQMFSAGGDFLCQWGVNGSDEMQFVRPNSLAVDNRDRIWVADSCNHRIQIFEIRDNQPKLVGMWGEEGTGVGQMRYPYDLVFDLEGNLLVAEFGNHRIQKFSPQGEPLGIWGAAGRGEGELQQPWAVVTDQRGRIHVLDTYNHRVQRFRL